jgi:hypothetical protein
VINEVLDDFCAFGGFKLAIVEASCVVKGLGLVDFHRVFFGDWAYLVEVILAGLDKAFDEIDVTLHFLKIRYQIFNFDLICITRLMDCFICFISIFAIN